ncbi:SDR family NAD(P)-dependent oxidoreductase [Corynebacterium glutamicum]|uniref:SDR family NAD(P)-dependent oxidoreductase n=1 Tax=Corynebacterium TaxID=1716 RepID=UPI00071EF777|nr:MULTISPECIES: SDR family NAD(P)-dependent oxidoreductase [Corynebacterium]ALP49285.1 3-oxoacyl-ACP reductase [Corynebacterium glutamicum]ANR61581.1 short-chain dehydrogenase/reductase SDR [[Brevibacterium] flavum ZL-1]ANR64581.1 short-chain dehydrogenase/reductase SDR [Corynebacterium glutamicum ZL-6]ANU32794.1 3-oxoacyl-ACP reductase [Corynebacterium glutamicum]APT06540.1 3-oxoacyl-ACP reductase [Corynebacterium glutamicum]
MMERTILLTGATGGLGRGLAQALRQEPGRLILHGRDPEKLGDLHAELAGSEAEIDLVVADLSDRAQVLELAEDIHALTDRLDVLVNNAGIGQGRGNVREVSADGSELRLAVNHLAPFTLSLLLLPLLKAAAPGKIVNVASAAQHPLDLRDLHLKQGYTGSRAYAQSKLAMIATGFHLAQRVPADQVTVDSLHPATLMPTAMVKEGWGYTVDDLATGVAATMHLITHDVGTGKYFTGTTEAHALPEAYDPDLRAELWEASVELAGTGDRD